MSVKGRVAKLERRLGKQEGTEIVYVIGLYGHEVPEECLEKLLEVDRSQNPGRPIRMLHPMEKGPDGEYYCRAYGQTHEVPETGGAGA